MAGVATHFECAMLAFFFVVYFFIVDTIYFYSWNTRVKSTNTMKECSHKSGLSAKDNDKGMLEAVSMGQASSDDQCR